MSEHQKTPGLFDFDTLHAHLQQTRLLTQKGTIQRVSGLTVESNGPDIGLGQPCEIRLRDKRTIPAEVIGFRGSNLVLLPLDHIDGISPGDTVMALNQSRCIHLGPQITGRVIDGLGRPIDGKGPLHGQETRSLDNPSPEPLQRRMITQPLPLGIRSIDGILTCGKGQRIGIFSGSGVGKSVLLGEIANGSDAQVNVVALVGERGREVREFLEKDLGPQGLARSILVVATSDSAAIQRVKAGFTAVTIAEYFRDQGMDVLFMMDSLTRFSQAQREIGLAAGEPPASKGYCPSVFALLPRLLERLGCNEQGSITGILTVLAEADDLNDPVADSARSLLDGHIVLSRKLADRGHYPAIDILQSISRLMTSVATEEHRKAALKFREIYATYTDAEDLISIGAFSPGSNRRIDGSVALIDRIQDFLIQPVRQRCRFPETVSKLQEIADAWDTLLSNHPTSVAAGNTATER
ncbi:MAG: FliI/YscN family ATPase [Sedimentisphaerales bacterium]|nr:FliI/YscN family ATPase [Sedimentisphaerales bacterium]